jgi:hypothetical protein
VSSDACSDVAGNTVSAVPSANFKIDETKPVASVTGVTNGTIYVKGSVPAAGCTTTDALSGVATSASLTVTGGTVNGVGSYTATCSGAVDVAGNAGDPASVTYSVTYGGLSGILQPINPDNTSIFKRGQAVPVKFKLAGDEYVGYNTSNYKIQAQSLPCGAFDGTDAILEDVPSNTPSTVFRYDASADQYIFNADMHNQVAGSCWNFKVTLDSSQVMYSAVFKLTK